MEETKYLKELQRQGRLPELLRALQISDHEFSGENFGCKITLTNKCLTVYWYRNEGFKHEEHKRKLNDYQILSGFKKEQKTEKMQVLYKFMESQFDTYIDDCLLYLDELKEKKQNQIDARGERAKNKVSSEIDDNKNLIQGFNK